MKTLLKELEEKIDSLSNDINNYKNIDKNVDAESINKKHLLNLLDDIDSDEDLLDILYKIRAKAHILGDKATKVIRFIENN